MGHVQYVQLGLASVEGTVPRDFRLQAFFMYQFSHSSQVSIRVISNFLRKFVSIFVPRCTTGVVDTSGKWKKSSNITPLGNRVNIKIIFLQVHFKV
jgi:hypothetical protein